MTYMKKARPDGKQKINMSAGTEKEKKAINKREKKQIKKTRASNNQKPIHPSPNHLQTPTIHQRV